MPFKISMKISITILGCLGPCPGVSASALTSTGEMICRFRERDSPARQLTSGLAVTTSLFHNKEDIMFELAKAAKEQLDMHFAGKEVSPIRVYMAAG